MKSDEREADIVKNSVIVAPENSGAIVFVAGEKSEVFFEANNNSICEVLYNSAEFSPLCAEYCGKAYTTAIKAGESVRVKCHAGLYYDAVPAELSEREKAAAIVGRVFIESNDYREAVKRASEGDWLIFPPEEFFQNVLIESSDKAISRAAARIMKLSSEEKREILSLKRNVIADREKAGETANAQGGKTSILEEGEISKLVEKFRLNRKNQKPATGKRSEDEKKKAVFLEERRAFFNSLIGLSYRDAADKILKFLKKHYEISDLAWLEKSDDRFETIKAKGSLTDSPFSLEISPTDPYLIEILERETALTFRESKSDADNAPGKEIYFFPLAANGEVFAGIVVADQNTNEKLITNIAGFLYNVSAELEILKLREEIERQAQKNRAIKQLTESLKDIDGNGFWEKVTRISAELMRAERSSLLSWDEDSGEINVKAAIGNRADIIKQENPEVLGRRIASKVLQTGKPLLVKDLSEESISPAPNEWRYKTNSFISYPITINNRKVGVLNVSDTVDGHSFDESDLRLLETVSPQLAVALDRISLKRKAGAFEQLSITDTLTGLVNRRYLEERLIQEISRSKRYVYPLSFLMIDVDDFKAYNDAFLHTEGDKALQIVAQCLKSDLRAADVAARYGGEEFSILLPQTALDEAHSIAERIRKKVEKTKFPNRQVTVSIGIACCMPSQCSAEDLVASADKALYSAKQEGRNNVQVNSCSVHAGA